jgi:hypothetical protein
MFEAFVGRGAKPRFLVAAGPHFVGPSTDEFLGQTRPLEHQGTQEREDDARGDFRNLDVA